MFVKERKSPTSILGHAPTSYQERVERNVLAYTRKILTTVKKMKLTQFTNNVSINEGDDGKPEQSSSAAGETVVLVG